MILLILYCIWVELVIAVAVGKLLFLSEGLDGDRDKASFYDR